MSDSKVTTRQSFEFGELWPDGTFTALSGYEPNARPSFDRRILYDYAKVPTALRPVFTTTETFPPEAVTP